MVLRVSLKSNPDGFGKVPIWQLSLMKRNTIDMSLGWPAELLDEDVWQIPFVFQDSCVAGILTPNSIAGWFNGFLEDTLRKISPWATQAIFRTKEQKIISGQEKVFLTSPCRLDIFLRVVLTILAAILLLVPVVILFELQPTDASQIRRKGGFQILTIFLFTLLFSASCSVCTKARRQEVFSATAAYCAVLVVFLGSTLNANVGG
ncbi:MAG: hypothetical protein Q9226_001433 [Calogaya cf. arnoldii]